MEPLPLWMVTDFRAPSLNVANLYTCPDVSRTVQPVRDFFAEPVFFSRIHSPFRLELLPLSESGESKNVAMRMPADAVADRMSAASPQATPVAMRFQKGQLLVWTARASEPW